VKSTRSLRKEGGESGGLRTAWGRFWFQPTDPTTLAFIRVITGLVVIYVHLAYCFDFQAFFGRHAWWGTDDANRERLEYPMTRPSLSWKDPRQRLQTPPLIDRRVAVFDFLRQLPDDRADRNNALRYLFFLIDRDERQTPVSENNFRAGLLLLKQSAQLLDEDRKTMVDALGKEQAPNPKEIPCSLPDFFLQMSPLERLAVWEQAQAFLEYLPRASSRTENFNYVLDWIQGMTFDERKELEKYLKELPSGEEKRKILDYFEYWRADPRDVDIKGRYIFSLWFHVSDPSTMWICHGVILFIMVLFAAGFCTRVTSVMTWLAALFYIHRTTHILFGMDTMMNILLFYLMIGPSGAALSVDRLIARYRASRAILRAGGQPVPWAEAVLAGPRPSAMANFTIRMIQIHFCFIYASSGLAKLKGATWWNTTGVWLTIANPEFTALYYPSYEEALYRIASHKPLLLFIFGSMTYFTLIVEITLPFLIWTRLRPYMVCLGIFLHSGIAWIMGLTCFGLLMMTLLLSYIPAAVIRERLTWAPGAGEKLSLRIHGRSPRQARLAAFLRAFDLTGQLTVVDESRKNQATEYSAQLIDQHQQHYTGAEIIRQAARTLVFLRAFWWLWWIPGVSMLAQRLLIDPNGFHDEQASAALSASLSAKTATSK